ncbi:uncharacterized protein LOC143868819 [Tasmannia lanceolata]|uniref:uncharacterized protein LOC143868819 n=1 Tax=Tasmannia lanceolata TaxID=3420 RepID=UPI0040643651
MCFYFSSLFACFFSPFCEPPTARGERYKENLTFVSSSREAETRKKPNGHDAQQPTRPLEEHKTSTMEEEQQQQQQVNLVEASKFRIRTSDRRHLDFDQEYDLNDTRAAQRSRYSGPFHFVQAADSQFGMIDSYVHKRTEPGWSEEIELCRQLIDTCSQMEPKPLFLIVCGDLVDAWPATDVRRRQVIDFKRIFARLDHQFDIPLVCVCGNHDVGDEPTMDGILEFKQTFGDDYFYFTKNDVLFIVINSQFYQHRLNVQDYAKEQDDWLEGLLSKCKLFKYSIVFEHIPWFLSHFDEEDDYFNIKRQVRLGWLRKFKDAGVTKIMCGHYHRNAGGWFEGMELVVTSAIGAQCGSDASGARIVKVMDQTIEHQYYAMSEIPKKIEFTTN